MDRLSRLAGWRAAPCTLALLLAGAVNGITHSPAIAVELPFEPEFHSLDTGDTPAGVAIEDLNGDGRNDFVVTSQVDRVLSVFLRGTHGFLVRRDYFTNVNPVGVALGDLDSDGAIDAVVASYWAIAVLRGNGEGGFTYRSQYPAGESPWTVVLHDLNGDAVLDAAIGTFVASTISVLLGDGQGGFGPPTALDVGYGGHSVAAGDLDGDGHADLATCNRESDLITIFLGNGNGTFQSPASFPTAEDPEHVETADLDGDGTLDLVVACFEADSIAVHWGLGGSDFSNRQAFATHGNPFWVEIHDVNRDGVLDLIAPNNNNASVSVLLGTGARGFGPSSGYSGGNAPRCLAVGNLNEDDHADIVAANLGSDSVSLLYNEGDGTFARRERYRAGPGAADIAILSLDGNAYPDVAVLNAGGSDPASVTVWHGDPFAMLSGQEELILGWAGDPETMTAGDLNDDGIGDLVIGNRGNRTVSIFYGNPNGFGERQDVEMPWCPMGVAISDVTETPGPEVIVTNVCDSTLTVLENSNGGHFIPGSPMPIPFQPFDLEAGDLNGDLRPDVVTQNREGLATFLLDRHGNLLLDATYDAGEGISDVAIADWNGDRWVDIVTANRSADRIGSVLLGRGDGTFGPALAIQSSRYGSSVLPTDIDNDGRVDLLFTSPASNAVSIVYGHGESSAYAPVSLGVGFGPTSLALGDLNGDGVQELVVSNGISQDLSVLRRVQGTTSPTPRNRLVQNHPNPFNPGTTITYQLATAGRVVIRIHDVRGRLVKLLHDGVEPVGTRTFSWDGTGTAGTRVPSGIYFCSITFPNQNVQTRKMTLIR